MAKNGSQIIDFDSPTANMYGCEPCPKCKSYYRAAYRRPESGQLMIECDACGYEEQATEIE